ncbi:MAG: hypothetical protein ABSE90_08520 [Verrucomicrobiota bacterium]
MSRTPPNDTATNNIDCLTWFNKISQMNPVVFSLAIEIAIESVFLTVALWIMIKLQNLEYKFTGLIFSAFLACGLNSILTYFLEPWFQDFAGFMSAPVYFIVLFVCVSKATQAEIVDVVFTVVVGGAIMFVMNLWLIGALMGDLRPSAMQARNEPFGDVDGGHPAAVETNRPNRLAPVIQTTNKAKTKNTIGGKSPAKPETANSTTPPPAAGARDKSAATPAQPAANLNGPVPVERVGETIKGFSLKGIVGGGKPSAMIYTGVKTYTVFQGDSRSMETPNGMITVRCEQLGKDRVALNIAGQQVTLSLPGAAP